MQYRATGSPHGNQCPSGLSTAQADELDRIEAEMREILGEAKSDSAGADEQQSSYRDDVDDERAFIDRFGFDWPRADRVAVIALKQRLDLTDREIRLLRWTGNLRRRNGVIALANARWAAVFGRCLVLVMWLEFTAIMLAGLLTMHRALSAAQLLQLCGATAMVLAMVRLAYLGYIRPWIIQQRVMRGNTPGLGRSSAC